MGSPILYRYIDWTITVPLQMIEFYLILSAVQPSLSVGVFYRLLFGTVFMLAAGYSGESHFINPVLGFVVGLCGWFFILSEIFIGEAGKCRRSSQVRASTCRNPSRPCATSSRSAGA